MESFYKFFKKVNLDVEYDPKQLKNGIKVEREHTKNNKIAEIIAKHHLEEDPEYYIKLKTLGL
jgi:hypothetical protein